MFQNQTTRQPMPLRVLYDLWKTLGDTPVAESPSGLRIDLGWLTFQKGALVEDIWHWFEKQNPRFIVGDVMQGKYVDDNGNPLPTANSEAMLRSDLDALINRGLTFGQCVITFGETDEDSRYLKAAREIYARDGELEFDDCAVVSESDDGGAYVMCWRWIDNADAPDQNELKIGDEVWLSDTTCESGKNLSGVYRVYRLESDDDGEVDEIELRNEDGYAIAQRDEVTKFDRAQVAEWVGLHYKVNFDVEPAERRNEWIRRYAEAQTTQCDDCGCHTTSIIGCPDGAEICKRCFEQGAH